MTLLGELLKVRNDPISKQNSSSNRPQKSQQKVGVSFNSKTSYPPFKIPVFDTKPMTTKFDFAKDSS